MLTAMTQTHQPKTQAMVEITMAIVRFSFIRLVLRRLLRAIDHDDFDRAFLRVQLQAKLLL